MAGTVLAGPGAFAALRSQPFRRYTIGQLPSVTCSWAQVVAVTWLVVELDPRALGWVVAAQFLLCPLYSGRGSARWRIGSTADGC